MKMKHLILYMTTAVISMTATQISAQVLHAAYFTQDFKYRHDMNPAFGNDQDYISLPGAGNINIKTMGNFGYEDVVKDNPLYPTQSDKKKTTFMNPYIDNALSGFNTGDNRIGGNVSITLMSAGFRAFHGYNTIELNSRSNMSGIFPYTLFEFARNTGNKRYDIGDICAEAQSFVELAFGHSHEIGTKWRVGAKVKLLLGVGDASFEFKNVTADLMDSKQWTISGDAQANVSMKGFNYKSETKNYKSTNGQYERINDVDVSGTGIGGVGMAADMGAIFKPTSDLTISAAVLDLGFITWTNDRHAENISKSFVFDGFHDTSVTSEGNTVEKQDDKYADQITDFINLQDKGDNGKRTTGIGATVNIGCEYTLPTYRQLSFGLLGSQRIDGKFSWTEGRLSANIAPLKWLDGGVNFAVNTFTTSMGWIVNVHPKGFNFFIGMDHLIGKCSKEFIPLSSNASLAIGMNITW
jgi:hypothetical protein